MTRLIALMLFAAASPAKADALDIQARVNKNRVALNDQILLTVTIQLDESAWPRPKLPSIPNFNIHSAGRRNRTNYINNRMSSRAEYDYLLVPRFVGKALIPPITVTHGGATARTKPIVIRVLPANAATPPPTAAAPNAPRPSRRKEKGKRGPDMYIVSEIDNKRPYVNEQVIMTVRFYLGVATAGDAQYEFPDTHGFSHESLGTLPPRMVKRRGRTYQLHEIRTALFPIKSGKLKIGPTKITAQVHQRADPNINGPDFFRLFFSQPMVTMKTERVRSKAIRVHTRPLPAKGKPADFTGAVGDYKILAEIEPQTVKVGEAVTLTVTVKGRGNLKTLGDVPLPKMDQFRVYETVSSLDIKTDANGVRGTKTYKTVLVPRVSGSLKIPPNPFNYFYPKKREYIVRQTPSIALPVSPGDAAPAPIGFQSAGPGMKITRLTSDIRHIKGRAARGRFKQFASFFSSANWIHMIPSMLFLGSAGFSLYRRKLLSNPIRQRSRTAYARAQKLLDKASSSGGATAAGNLGEALTGYIADKINRPTAGLTQREARTLLQKKFPKIPDGHYHQLKILWEDLEIQRYAPIGGQDTETARGLEKDIRVLLEALEEAIDQ